MSLTQVGVVSLTQVGGGEDSRGWEGLALGLIHVYFCLNYTSLWGVGGLLPPFCMWAMKLA